MRNLVFRLELEMTVKDLITALKAYYVELHMLGADREAEAIKQFMQRLGK